jgi:hypothetical protein
MKTVALASLILCLSVSGCIGTSIPVFRSLTDVPQGQAIVAGKVKVVVKELAGLDENALRARTDARSNSVFFIVPEQGGTLWNHSVTTYNDGAIYWQLPPGTYDISAFTYSTGPGPQTIHIIRPMRVRFTIPHEHKAVYIGSLVITFENKDSLLQSSYVVEVEDEYESVRESLKRKFVGPTDAMVKHLMRQELLR